MSQYAERQSGAVIENTVRTPLVVNIEQAVQYLRSALNEYRNNVDADLNTTTFDEDRHLDDNNAGALDMAVIHELAQTSWLKTMPHTMVVATHNAHKLQEIQRIISADLPNFTDVFHLQTASELELPDPVEDGVTFIENANIKSIDVAHRTLQPALADDSGIIVDFLGNAPGILSARWSGAHGDDNANNALLLSQIRDIPAKNRQAHYIAALSIAFPNNNGDIIMICNIEGAMHGYIAHEQRGDHGFGYDPMFVPNHQPHGDLPSVITDELLQTQLTLGQIDASFKDTISHRGIALAAIVPLFNELIFSK